MVLLKHAHEEELKCWQVVRDCGVGLAQLLQSSVSCPCSSEVHSWRGTKEKHKNQWTPNLYPKRINRLLRQPRLEENWHSHNGSPLRAVCVMWKSRVNNGANGNLPSSCPSIAAWLAYCLCRILRQDCLVLQWHRQKPKKIKTLLTTKGTIVSIILSLHQEFKRLLVMNIHS